MLPFYLCTCRSGAGSLDGQNDVGDSAGEEEVAVVGFELIVEFGITSRPRENLRRLRLRGRDPE